MNIFSKISVRYSKSRYRGLTPDQKKMVKLSEEEGMLNRSIAKTYELGKLNYGENFRTDERFFNDFELIFKWEKRLERINQSIHRLEEKTGQTVSEVCHLRNQLNRTPGSSF